MSPPPPVDDAIPDWRERFVAEDNTDFNCVACGRFVRVSDGSRYYEAAWCAHPTLRALGNRRICPACYNWDYDGHRRRRRFTRGGLRLRDGIVIQVNEEKHAASSQTV
jgi:hypothetical protein